MDLSIRMVGVLFDVETGFRGTALLQGTDPKEDLLFEVEMRPEDAERLLQKLSRTSGKAVSESEDEETKVP